MLPGTEEVFITSSVLAYKCSSEYIQNKLDQRQGNLKLCICHRGGSTLFSPNSNETIIPSQCSNVRIFLEDRHIRCVIPCAT
jgi:hypothetical protein